MLWIELSWVCYLNPQIELLLFLALLNTLPRQLVQHGADVLALLRGHVESAALAVAVRLDGVGSTAVGLVLESVAVPGVLAAVAVATVIIIVVVTLAIAVAITLAVAVAIAVSVAAVIVIVITPVTAVAAPATSATLALGALVAVGVAAAEEAADDTGAGVEDVAGEVGAVVAELTSLEEL